MDVILVVCLPTETRRDLLSSRSTILFDRGVVNMPAVHTPQAPDPHLPKLAVHVEELVCNHQTTAA